MNSPRYHPIMRYIARHTTATFGIPFEYLPYSGYCQPSGDFSPIVPNSPFSPKSPLSRGLAIFLYFYQICHFRQNRHSLSPKSLLSKGPILASNLNRHHSGVFFLPFFPFSPLLDILDVTQILLLIIDRYVLHYLCVTEYDTLFISDTTLKAVIKRLAKQIKLTQNSNEDIPSNWISNPIISSTPVGPFIPSSTDVQRKCDISVIKYFYPGDIWRRFTNSYTVQIQGCYIFANNNRLIPGDVGDAWWLYKINLITVNQNCHYS